MVQQWQCYYLMDNAASNDSNTSSSGSGAAATSGAGAATPGGSSSRLDEACTLLGATASPTTPFR